MSIYEKNNQGIISIFSSIMFKYEKIRKKLAILAILAGVIALMYILLGYYGKKTDLPPLANKLPAQFSNAIYPAQIINLNKWKLTIPLTSGDSRTPIDIKQPELATYKIDPWFIPTSDKLGVIFRAPVNAETTANSDYPRSELREMTDDGTEEFFWPSTSGVHTLTLTQAITAVPKNKPHVVAGQIHGDDDDLIVIRLEYPKLYIARGKSDLATLDENYTLGKKFTIKFVASDGKIAVYYNNSVTPAYTLDKKVKQAYFKAGVYTQSNCETEGAPELCTADNFGEVVIYDAKVEHR